MIIDAVDIKENVIEYPKDGNKGARPHYETLIEIFEVNK